MRRLFSSEKIRLDPAPGYNDAVWSYFSKAVNSCRIIGNPHKYDEELEQYKFQFTAGFPDFYVDLHCSIETILSKDKDRKVDKALIELAAKKSAKLMEMKPLINAFIKHDSTALRMCLDVDNNYYQQLWMDGISVGESNPQAGPVAMVATQSKATDVAKSLEEDKKRAGRRSKMKTAKAEKQINPAAASVRNHHLDGLAGIISGKAQNNKEE